VRDRIRENPEIADSGVELDALAAMPEPEQRRAVALVEAGQAAGIRDARRAASPFAPAPAGAFFRPGSVWDAPAAGSSSPRRSVVAGAAIP
jgi:hypothetical protein